MTKQQFIKNFAVIHKNQITNMVADYLNHYADELPEDEDLVEVASEIMETYFSKILKENKDESKRNKR